jgi:SAM-dependent methyltransferase
MKKINLNDVSSEYLPNSATEIENNLMLNWYPKRVVKRFAHSESLLELGIGHGFTSQFFQSASDKYTVIDGSSVVIEQFKNNNPEFSGTIVEGYFEEYTTDELYDVIVMGFILEHVDDPSMILNHYRSFLKPDGKLFIAVPNAKSMNRRLGLELGMIDDIYSLNKNDLALGHQRQYCIETLTETVKNTGYKVVYTEGIYLKPLPLDTLKTLNGFNENLQAMLHVGLEFPELCVAILMELEAE